MTDRPTQQDRLLTERLISAFLQDDRGRSPQPSDKRFLSSQTLRRFVDARLRPQWTREDIGTAHRAIDRFAANYPRILGEIQQDGQGMIRCLELARLNRQISNRDFLRMVGSTETVLEAALGERWDIEPFGDRDVSQILEAARREIKQPIDTVTQTFTWTVSTVNRAVPGYLSIKSQTRDVINAQTLTQFLRNLELQGSLSREQSVRMRRDVRASFEAAYGRR